MSGQSFRFVIIDGASYQRWTIIIDVDGSLVQELPFSVTVRNHSGIYNYWRFSRPESAYVAPDRKHGETCPPVHHSQANTMRLLLQNVFFYPIFEHGGNRFAPQDQS